MPQGDSDNIPVARKVLITRDYLRKFGFTPGCAKCTAIERGDNSRVSLAHSEVCRSRIEKELKEDPFLCKRIERAQDRQAEDLARRVEAGDSTKRARSSQDEVEFQPGPGGPRSLEPQMQSLAGARMGVRVEVDFPLWERICGRQEQKRESKKERRKVRKGR